MALGANAEREEERSLRDDLAAGLKEIEEREASEAAAAPEGDDTPAPEAEAKVEPTETKADRGDGRDAHGRFLPKGSSEASSESHTKAPDTAAPLAAAPAHPAPEAATAAESAAASTEGDIPPKSWRSDEAQAWKDLPATAKSAILRREAEAARLAGANDTERMFGREFAEVVRPHMATFQQFQVSPQFAVKALLDSDRILRSGTQEQKLEKARQLISDYGIDLTALANAPQQDPNVAALNARIAQLEHSLTNPQGQQFAPLPPTAEEGNIMAEIEAFRADPAHPHFDAVHAHMGKLLETGAAPDLESAYQAAVAMAPALRSTVAAQAPQRTQQEKTAAARQAAVSVAGSPGPTGNPAPQTLRDELAQNLRNAGFSV